MYVTYVISYEFSLLDASSHNKVILALCSGTISIRSIRNDLWDACTLYSSVHGCIIIIWPRLFKELKPYTR